MFSKLIVFSNSEQILRKLHLDQQFSIDFHFDSDKLVFQSLCKKKYDWVGKSFVIGGIEYFSKLFVLILFRVKKI